MAFNNNQIQVLRSENTNDEFSILDPLYLPLILEKIFAYLSTVDLYKCRRVCRIWNSTIVGTLRKKDQLVQLTKTNLPTVLKYLSAQDEPTAGLYYLFEACTCDLNDKVWKQLIQLTELIGSNCIRTFRYTWHSDENSALCTQELFTRLIKLIQLISTGLEVFIILPQMPRIKQILTVPENMAEMREDLFPELHKIQFGTYFDTNFYNSKEFGGDWNSCSKLLSFLLNSSPNLQALQLQDLTVLHLPPNLSTSSSRRESTGALSSTKFNPELTTRDLEQLSQLNDCKYLSIIEEFEIDLSNNRVREVAANAFQFENLKSLASIKFMFGKFRPAEAKIFFQSLPMISKLKQIEYNALVSTSDVESLNVVSFSTEFIEKWPKLENICWKLDFDMVSCIRTKSGGYRIEFEMNMKKGWHRLTAVITKLKEKLRGDYVEPTFEIFKDKFSKLDQVIIENQCGGAGASMKRTFSAYNNVNEEFLQKFTIALLQGVSGIKCLEFRNFQSSYLRYIFIQASSTEMDRNLQGLAHLAEKQVTPPSLSKDSNSRNMNSSLICRNCEQSFTNNDFEEFEDSIALNQCCNKNYAFKMTDCLPNLKLFEKD